MAPPSPAVSTYQLPGFDWSSVVRVLVLPVHNESAYTRADSEVREALCAEFQKLGRFEAVSPPPDYPSVLAETIRNHGCFNEAVMLDLARCFNVDLVIHASITRYSPYPRPHLGLTIRAVSPFEGKVVASADGLWDTNHPEVAQRVREHYSSPHLRGIYWLAATLDGNLDTGASEVALDSPRLFQRFVCCEIVKHVIGRSRSAVASSASAPAQAPGKFDPLPQ